jgi:toxin-antitoxin system PIN domain toxin
VFILDVNVVLAAHRADHVHHAHVRRWFDELLAGDGDFGVPDLVWGSFLRLATNRRIFNVPTPRIDAFTFIDATIAQPRHLTVAPGPRHLTLVRRLCDEADATGDLVPDAVLGAIAVEHGASIATLDRDFARFTSVRHQRLGP